MKFAKQAELHLTFYLQARSQQPAASLPIENQRQTEFALMFCIYTCWAGYHSAGGTIILPSSLLVSIILR